MENSLSDIGSWASIIGFIFSFILGIGTCKITKDNKQVNKFFSFLSIGNINQNNDNNQ
jgi:L-cystine uptake protein TcyP (sodium:dicarboxylate symporter family)